MKNSFKAEAIMHPGRISKFLSLIFCLFVLWGEPALGSHDILDAMLSDADVNSVVFDENTNQVLPPEEQREIINEKIHLAQSMRKMLLGCTSYKRGGSQTSESDPLSEWPGLKSLCLPAGETTLEEKKSAAERATFFYCKETLVPEFCDSFEGFKDYCTGELIRACFAGYSAKPL